MKRVVLICFAMLGSSLTVVGQQTPADLVIQFLGFSEVSAADFRTALNELQSSISGIQRRVEAKRRDLNLLLSVEVPNEAAVGKAVVELNGLQREFQSAIQRYQERFEGLLTPEKMERVMNVVQARELLPAVMAFAAVELVAPPGAPQN